MKRRTRSILSAALLASMMLLAAQAADDRKPIHLDLRIAPEGWNCEVSDVEAVLRSAGDELTPWYGPHDLPAIHVEPRGGPIVLYERAADGAIQMKLNTGDRLWAQMSFQFAHELCHVMCVYDDDDTGCKWFEETMCEAASLFVLRKMANTWREHPPYRNWASYAGALDDYANQRLAAAKLPEGLTLAKWYAQHATELRAKADNRPLNNVAAAALLPFIEAEPEHWEAVRWLNVAHPAKPQSMSDYLTAWRDNAPPEHRPFIARLAAALGVLLPR
ncbi:MAG: hypothetical protein GC162_14510 [Planctomycetes bacterium]|nr:hypothetical protein [Planctomycetota bacterium]